MDTGWTEAPPSLYLIIIIIIIIISCIPRINMAARPFIFTVMSPVDIDINVFALWLKGYSPSDAARERLKNEPQELMVSFPDYNPLLVSETEEMYSLFKSIEPYLQFPPTFVNQSVFQVCFSCGRGFLRVGVALHYGTTSIYFY